jgi:translation initiation factor 5
MVASRMKELSVSGAVSRLLDEEEGDDPLDEFADYVTSNLSTITDEDIVQKSVELNLREDKVIAILAQTVFDSNILVENQVENRAELLKKFLKGEKCQKALIGGIERLVGITHRKLIPRIALIFKDLYFLDLVDEEVFLAWGEKVSKRYVDKRVAQDLRNKAAPFLEWLKTAEEESD